MWKVIDEIDIDAPPVAVYDVIADVGSYDQWNPWIIRASGPVAEGSVIRVTVRLGARRMKLEHRILATRRGEEFRWCDMGWFTRLAYGERARFLTPSGSGTRYRVELSITGVASRLVGATMGRDLTAKLHTETLALKQRAEALHQQSSRQSAP